MTLERWFYVLFGISLAGYAALTGYSIFGA
jgi:hypothetical protein